jgi:hypothetical protein
MEVMKPHKSQQGELAMIKNNTLVYCLKRDLLNFAEKISDGLDRTKEKFLPSMLYGILASQSVMLTKIGRALQETISIKKTVERLSRNLKDFHQDTAAVKQNYLEEIKPYIDDDTIFCLDPGDISKTYSRHQEGLDWLWDGSAKTTARGWHLYEMVALTHKKKLPIPVYTQVVSPSDPISGGQTEEILTAIRSTQQTFGTAGIFTMDRGMDNDAIYEHCLDSNQNFVIRSKVNRRLIVGDKILETSEIAEDMRGKYRLDFTDKKNTNHRLKVSFQPVRLPSRSDKLLTLVIVYGFDKDEPMLLLTNLSIDGKQTCLRVVKTYLCRWRVEEYYRFKKTQFDMENIRVLSMDSICAMVFLLSVLSGWIAMLANKKGESSLLEAVLSKAKRVHGIPQFTLYAVADGIYDILKRATRGICFALLRPLQSQQLSLFKFSTFNHSAA